MSSVVQDTLSPEDVIRTYLRTLEDPGALVDDDEVAKLADEVRAATDPIDKLRALAALNRAKTPDVDFYRSGFIQHARDWAETNDIPLSTFAELGVSRDVLRSAGLLHRRSKPTDARRSITARQIEAEVGRFEGVFTLADIARDIGGSPMTIRKAVEKLVVDGVILKLGPTPNWAGRGRAPLQFRKA